MTSITTSPEEAGKVCPYCRFPLKQGAAAERCDACSTIHHDECWADGGGCAVHGCKNSAAARRAAAPTVVGQAAPAAPTQAQPAYPAMSAQPPSPSNNRTLIIGVGAALLVAIIAVGALLLTRKSPHQATAAAPPVTTVATVTQQVTTSAAPTARPVPTNVAEERAARRLVAIVDYSQRGRDAVRAGRYAEAIANRQETLARLDALPVSSPRLARAVDTFRNAIQASLSSDQAYESGGNATVYDAEATTMKKRFVAQFNPIARKYALPTFDAGEI